MKRICTLFAMVAILMAGFTSVCTADADCASDQPLTSAHGCPDLIPSKAPSQEVQKDHCGMLCHTAAFNIPQVTAKATGLVVTAQERIQSTDDTISLGLYTVLDQPPRRA